MPIDKAYYNVEDVAALWHCSYDTVLGLIRKRKLRAFKVGTRWQIASSALEECQALLEEEGGRKG